jgi:mannan endo-1,4-beta-mannosidase
MRPSAPPLTNLPIRAMARDTDFDDSTTDAAASVEAPPAAAAVAPAAPLPWIETRPGLPYFVTAGGPAWTPVGHNEAIAWPNLAGLFRRRDVAAVRSHLRLLKASGVTCLRLMLEYAQGRHRYLERPVGRYAPNMVQLWDDLFALCEEVGLHVLLTPFDTFFTWRQWQHHPYNAANGGPCDDRGRLMTCAATRDAVKSRLEFATRRWGASPALFAWDLWNEMHPAHGGDDPAACAPFVADLSGFLRSLELRLHGRAHLQTVSIFGPELIKAPVLCEPVFRHPGLDFANTHLYEFGTIDDPRDTVAPARAVGRLMRAAVQEADDGRPVFDSEHGPIHAFMNRHRRLGEPFDDEYFRHIQWAHLASGGAGGGMRWPNRHPHVLTAGMHRAQHGLARFLPLVDWTRFRRRNLNEEASASSGFAVFACGDERQAVVWLLREDSIGTEGMLRTDAAPRPARIVLPGLAPGRYRWTGFDTRKGMPAASHAFEHAGGELTLACGDVTSDLAVAIAPEHAGMPHAA